MLRRLGARYSSHEITFNLRCHEHRAGFLSSCTNSVWVRASRRADLIAGRFPVDFRFVQPAPRARRFEFGRRSENLREAVDGYTQMKVEPPVGEGAEELRRRRSSLTVQGIQFRFQSRPRHRLFTRFDLPEGFACRGEVFRILPSLQFRQVFNQRFDTGGHFC